MLQILDHMPASSRRNQAIDAHEEELDRRRMPFGEIARRRAPSRLLRARAQALGLLLLVTGSGRAAEHRAQAARSAYDSAAAAYNSGDFNAAAEQFARADELAPNPTTLKLAIA